MKQPQQTRLKVLAGKPAGMIMVNEIFRSIQGESTLAGLPCVLVRLAGCHLRCRWCDTQYAFNEGQPMSLDEVIGRVAAEACGLVEITGGEPLLQPESQELMRRLADQGLAVMLETSGSLDISLVDRRVHIVMDLKCPGSGETEQNRYENIELLKASDDVKFVIADRSDFDWACAQVRRFQLTGRCNVLFAPAFGLLEPSRLADWLLQARLPVRLQLQLHKLLWPGHQRGV